MGYADVKEELHLRQGLGGRFHFKANEIHLQTLNFKRDVRWGLELGDGVGTDKADCGEEGSSELCLAECEPPWSAGLVQGLLSWQSTWLGFAGTSAEIIRAPGF